MRNLKKTRFALSFVVVPWVVAQDAAWRNRYRLGEDAEGRAWGSTRHARCGSQRQRMGVRALRRQLLRGIVAAAGSAIRFRPETLCARSARACSCFRTVYTWIAMETSGGRRFRCGRQGPRVVKFNREGKVLLTLASPVSRRFDGDVQSPVSRNYRAQRDIYVSDGHGGDSNSRIMKFAKDGKLIKTWGKKARSREFGELHGIALDSRARVRCNDRGNNRIQILMPCSSPNSPGPAPFLAPGLDELAVFRELHDARVGITAMPSDT